MMRPIAQLVFIAMIILTCTSFAIVVPLYDGTLNTTPDLQGWIYQTLPVVSSATQNAGGGVTTLDTSAVESDSAGYFSEFPLLGSHPSFPTELDRLTGFKVSFGVEIIQENHSSSDRAGFSVIALSEDMLGLEVGFWEDEIWVQDDDPIFTHGEGVAFDTTVGITDYDLTILQSGYTLYANGSPILQGALRDYSSFGFPYDTPSFVFLGDDTSSASAIIDLASAEVETALVPEPRTNLLMAAVMIVIIALRWYGFDCLLFRNRALSKSKS